MAMGRANRSWVIAVSFVVALMLTAVPLPEWALPWRPAWIALVLIYWCIALPERVGVLTGWVVGMVLDVMHGSILGQHAFGLAFVAYVAVLYHQRVRVFPLGQQATFVGSVVFAYLLLMLWIYNLLGSITYRYEYLFATISSTILWPWIFVILRDIRRKVRVV